MNKLETINEDLGDMAREAELDHEVQMARSDLYKSAKYAVSIHKMLKDVSEMEGIDGWVAAKITKAADYLGSVKHYMEGQAMSDVELAVVPVAGDMTDAMTMPQESTEEVYEADKPDFLDLDKDGDKKEPMKKAAKDAKDGNESEVKEMNEEDVIGDIIAKLPKTTATKQGGYSKTDRDMMNKLIAKVDGKTPAKPMAPTSPSAVMSPVTKQKQANQAA